MQLFKDNGVSCVFHYAPLHYLPFIATAKALLAKPQLRALGFAESHFRSSSKGCDEERGFGEYVHLTVMADPPILHAKLSAGFPHIQIAVPAAALADNTVHLCRYNIAKARYLRRHGSPGFPETPRNGRYYASKQLPTAQTPTECRTLFDLNFPHTMIEVLVPSRLELPDDTEISFFHPCDLGLGRTVLEHCKSPWTTALAQYKYQPSKSYVEAVQRFLEKALADSAWRGDGLEFDQV